MYYNRKINEYSIYFLFPKFVYKAFAGSNSNVLFTKNTQINVIDRLIKLKIDNIN